MRDSGTSSPCFSAPWMGTAGKGEGKSSYLPASVLDKGSAGFNRNPVMLALLPPLQRRCSSPGVREEQARCRGAGRGGWLCPSRCVLSWAVHTISLQQGILVPQPRGLWKLVPSHSQVPRVAGALLILEEHVLCSHHCHRSCVLPNLPSASTWRSEGLI